jgi:hypothetical protein
MKKNKAKSSTQIPAPAPDAPEPLDETSPPPDETPEIEADETSSTDETPEIEADETSSTEVLFGLLFEAWLGSRFRPCFHWMERTYGHHRVGDRYDTNKIFDQLDLLGGGDHNKLLEELKAFRDACFEDLSARLADRDKNA